MGQKLYVRECVMGEELHKGISRGVSKVFSIAQAAYGAASGNVMIENRADAPTISHDGVTNIAVLEVENQSKIWLSPSLSKPRSELTTRRGTGQLSPLFSPIIFTNTRRKNSLKRRKCLARRRLRKSEVLCR